MIRIELTPDEAEKLRGVLQSYLADLRMEIAGTDSATFREELKRTESFLKALLTRLAA